MSSAVLAAAPDAVSRPAVDADARVRVAFVHNLMDVGGTEINALKTAQRLDRSRFDLVVLTFAADGPLDERYEAAGVRVVRIGLTTLIARGFVNEDQRFPVLIPARTYVGAIAVVLLAAAVAGLLMRRRLDRMDLVAVLKTRE